MDSTQVKNFITQARQAGTNDDQIVSYLKNKGINVSTGEGVKKPEGRNIVQSAIGAFLDPIIETGVHAGQAVADLTLTGVNKVTGGALDRFTPEGNLGQALNRAENTKQTVPAIGTDVKKAKDLTAENIAGNAIKTVALAAPGVVTGGAALAAGDALSKDKSVGNVAIDTVVGALSGKILEYGFNAVAPYVEKAVQKYGAPLAEKLSSYVPEASKVAFNNFLDKDITGGLANKEIPAITKIVDKTSSIASNIENKGKEILSNVTEKAKGYVENSGLKAIKNEWTRPTTIPKAAYSDATQIFKNETAKGHSIPDTLVKLKINPADVIVDGKFSTIDEANAIRKDAMQFSHDTLRPSLKVADYSTEVTPVDDVINQSIENIRKNNKIVSETKKTLIKNLEDTRISLKEDFPNGIKISDVHDEKITRDLNAKYNQFSDTGKTLDAQKNKAVADALRTKVEEKFEPAIPFNKELTKMYRAADYLEALNGKEVPQTFAQKAVSKAARAAGLAVGETVGGGIGGGYVGYHAGAMIDSLLGSLPNPIKEMALRNLEVANPEAFNTIQEYIKNEITSRAGQKALPAPKGDVIIQGGKDDAGYNIDNSGKKTPIETKAKVTSAKKNPVSVNPKTGKFQTSYSSNSGITTAKTLAAGSVIGAGIAGEAVVKNKQDQLKKLQENKGNNLTFSDAELEKVAQVESPNGETGDKKLKNKAYGRHQVRLPALKDVNAVTNGKFPDDPSKLTEEQNTEVSKIYLNEVLPKKLKQALENRGVDSKITKHDILNAYNHGTTAVADDIKKGRKAKFDYADKIL